MNRSQAIIAAIVAFLLIGGGLAASHLQGSLMSPVSVRCPPIVTAANNGGTITCRVASRFTIELDRHAQPIEHLSCEPKGNLGVIASNSPTDTPTYTVQFEGVQPGTCVMRNDSFAVTVTVVR